MGELTILFRLNILLSLFFNSAKDLAIG